MHNLRDRRDAEPSTPLQSTPLQIIQPTESPATASSGQTDLVQQLQSELESEQIAAQQTPAPAKKQNHHWILHPAIDLIFACGAWIWVYTALMVIGIAPDVTKHGTGLYVLAGFSLVTFALTNAHQPVTLFRVYGSSVTRRTLGKVVTILGLICIALGFAVTSSPFMASLIARFTVGLTAQHFYAQTYGVSLIYCYKRNYYLSVWEKRLFFWMIQAGIGSTIVHLFARDTIGVAGFTLEKVVTIPPWVCWSVDGVLALSVVTVTVAVVRRWFLKHQMMPFPAILNVATCFFVLIYLPLYGNGSIMALAIITQAFYHNLQYIVVAVSFYLKEQGMPEGLPATKISQLLTKPVGLKYFAWLTAAACLAGIVISPGINQIGVHFGAKLELVACAYYCATTLHHCLSDALIWRMKDPTILKLLVS